MVIRLRAPPAPTEYVLSSASAYAPKRLRQSSRSWRTARPGTRALAHPRLAKGRCDGHGVVGLLVTQSCSVRASVMLVAIALRRELALRCCADGLTPEARLRASLRARTAAAADVVIEAT